MQSRFVCEREGGEVAKELRACSRTALAFISFPGYADLQALELTLETNRGRMARMMPTMRRQQQMKQIVRQRVGPMSC
jgi:hypothetical protein